MAKKNSNLRLGDWWDYTPYKLNQQSDAVLGAEYTRLRKIANARTVDAVEVVRCRDCKHWHKDTVFCDYMSYREASERVNWYSDDFCSYGERKGDK